MEGSILLGCKYDWFLIDIDGEFDEKDFFLDASHHYISLLYSLV